VQFDVTLPTIKDRVVQTAAKLVLEPIFEADLDPEAFGYRPRRSAVDAVRCVHGHLKAGYTDVVDADLSKYFDTIPHGELLKCVARRISDRHVLALIKAWLKAPVEERAGTGGKRLIGGKGSKCGTPQGGVISPLLANIYMNRFLKHWRQNGLAQRFRAHVVVYADDLVILSRGCAQGAHEVLRDVMTRIGLTVNETKTKLREATTERFDFLGYTFGPFWERRTGKRYLGAAPSPKSRKRLKAKVHALMVPGNLQPWPQVCQRLNRLLRGWQQYFCYGTLERAYSEVNWYVADRVRHFLRRRHKVPTRGTRPFSTELVFTEHKVLRLGRRPLRAATPHAFA
jgi:RNA-directed DNA polymerase